MSERLSAAEVVEELEKVADAASLAARLEANADAAGKWHKATGDRYDEGLAAGYAHAAYVVREHLVPQWQAEPTGDGWYWVEGWMEHPRYVQRSGESWTFSLRDYSMGPLLGRRVCPISGPPSDEKGGA